MAARSCPVAIPILMALMTALMPGAGLADEAMPAGAKAKPECSAETEHMVWPEKSERRSGGLVEICVSKHARYRWQALTVDISELRAKAKAAAAGNRPAASQAASQGSGAPVHGE